MHDPNNEEKDYVAYPRETYVYEPPPHGFIRLPRGEHSVVIPAMLSVLLVGGGQMYNRQFAKGGVIMGLCFLTCGLAGVVLWPLAIVDAALIASKLRKGHLVHLWEFF